MSRWWRLGAAGAAGLIALALAAGCSADPHEGGFLSGVYGLASGNYQKRVDQKRANVADLQRNQQELLADRQRLDNRQRVVRARIYSTQAQLRDVEADLARLRRQLRTARANTAAKQAEKARIEAEVAKIKAKIEALKKNRTMGTSAKRQELKRLKKRVQWLRRSAVNLM